MRTDELDFYLPEELIAQQATVDRSSSRLMVLHRNKGQIEHRHFRDIEAYLCPNDCLVLNNTQVIPARFFMKRQTGGKLEGLFLHLDEQRNWVTLLKGAGKVKPGEVLLLEPAFIEQSKGTPTIEIKAIERLGDGHWLISPVHPMHHLDLLNRYGMTPLPPYIHRERDLITDENDRYRYQTVYASVAGSVAAPTAGLHFTPELLTRLEQLGIQRAEVTLHVGVGTFRPVTVDNLNEHIMHSEWYALNQRNAGIINQTRNIKGRIVPVGTTSVRTLESIAQSGSINAGQGETDIFIKPGYEFKATDVLITNFHLPRSTLLALVSAFAGLDFIKEAYQIAIKEKYRFFSYGDAMLIL